MRRLASILVSVWLLGAQSAPLSVVAVRHWSLNEVTRIAIEVTGPFEFRSDRIHNPERVYFDIVNARPRFAGKRLYRETIDDRLVSSVRVAETLPGVTRVVLDLSGPVEIATSQLINPDRLIVELRPGTAAPGPPVLPEPPAVSTSSALRPESLKVETSRPFRLPERPASLPEPPTTGRLSSEPSRVQVAKAEPAPGRPGRETPLPEKRAPEGPALERPALPKPALEKPALDKPAPIILPEPGKAARRTSTGGTSLVRTLGLKVGRIVIDPGHGGHDQGTSGPKGLLEKDLVLDVAQRLGKLIETRMGAEVIYTRTDDTFVPLGARTAFATGKKADLFLSIHANSSPVSRTTGVETYYLNFTDSRQALEVATRENASSEMSVSELRDAIQKITLHEKAEESREFASRVQNALYAFSARSFPGSKNRGVKKAPFVVLIGASIPSVLAEIGFVSNAREEALLKKPEYREKLAEALFRGIQSYAQSLSHFQVAQAGASK